MIEVQHEGIALDELGPDGAARVALANGINLKPGDPVVTFVARNLEPYRGFHVFMRALDRIQRRHKTCHAVIVGGDQVSYGRPPKDAPNWREHMMREVTLDPARTHFMGRIPRSHYIALLQVSAVHVYLTYPFVLSWSLLEAMACGAAIVASDTAPVREVIADGVNGHLVDFHSVDALAQQVLTVLGGASSDIRQRAQNDAQRFGQKPGLLGYERLLRTSDQVSRSREGRL